MGFFLVFIYFLDFVAQHFVIVCVYLMFITVIQYNFHNLFEKTV